MPRIAPITGKADVAPEYHYVVDQVLEVFGNVRGPFSILLHSPKLAERLLKLVTFNRDESVVRAALRSLAILAAVREKEAAYVWAAQVGAARRAGVPEAVIDLLRTKGDPAGLPADQRDIIVYTRQLMRTNRVGSGGVRCAEGSVRRAVAGRADGGGKLLRVPVRHGERVRGAGAGGW